MIVGICGYTGSGKSSAAKYLCEKNGFAIIDADKLARKLMLENADLICEVGKTFGVVRDGKIDFVKLGNIAFESVENLKKLNSLTFPYIIPAIKHETAAADFAILDAALLPLISPQEICNFAIWMECDILARIERLRNRTNLSIDTIRNRIEKQMQLISRPPDCNFWKFIKNNSSFENLFSELDEINKICVRR